MERRESLEDEMQMQMQIEEMRAKTIGNAFPRNTHNVSTGLQFGFFSVMLQ